MLSSRVIVDAIDAWTDERFPSTPPKRRLGVALTYAKNQRRALRRFLDDQKLPLDNSASQRVLRILAVGRKHFLFVGHTAGPSSPSMEADRIVGVALDLGQFLGGACAGCLGPEDAFAGRHRSLCHGLPVLEQQAPLRLRLGLVDQLVVGRHLPLRASRRPLGAGLGLLELRL
ncbi:MAG: transposase [Proteobacteria bacterium]|nr:transposase [Pseudomonadota bacterium]